MNRNSRDWRQLRLRVLRRDNYQCQIGYAGCEGVASHVDHIVPICRGGDDDATNLRASCAFCNLSKGGRLDYASDPHGWDATVEVWMRHLAAGGVTRGTLRLRRFYVRRFASETGLAWNEATPEDVERWLSQQAWAPETRKSAVASLRGFYGWCVRSGRLQVDPCRQVLSVRVPPSRPRPAPLEVLPEQGAVDARVELMLLLAMYAGLRRAEIAALHTRDVTAEGLRIVGKGGRVRVVPLHPVLGQRLGVLPAGYVFGSRTGHLTADRVGRLMSQALGPGWSAHTLRHRFATRLYETSGHDLLAVQQLLGHASPATTQRYTLVASKHLAAAVAAA